MDDFENLIIDEDDEDEEDVDDKDEDVFKADEDGLNFNFSEIAKKSDANSNNSNNGVLAVVEDAGKLLSQEFCLGDSDVGDFFKVKKAINISNRCLQVVCNIKLII